MHIEQSKYFRIHTTDLVDCINFSSSSNSYHILKVTFLFNPGQMHFLSSHRWQIIFITVLKWGRRSTKTYTDTVKKNLLSKKKRLQNQNLKKSLEN